MTGTKSLFASVIEDHLALKRRNAGLEISMPLDRFIPVDPFDNHSLFKSEHDARLEEEETGEHPAVTLEWSGVNAVGEQDDSWLDRQKCSDFNWGD